MPLALDNEQLSYRPTKRRRLQEKLKMARKPDSEGEEPMYHSRHSEGNLLAGCEEQSTKGHTPAAPQSEIHTSDRDELIECIKRGERPTWVPKPGLKALYAEEQALQERKNPQHVPESPTSPTSTNFQIDDDLLFGSWTGTNDTAQQPRSTTRTGYFDDEDVAFGTDSSTKHAQSGNFSDGLDPPLSTSPNSWLESGTYAHIGQALSASRPLAASKAIQPSRPRAPSLSSSFMMRVPTSPLVNAVNNPNLDFSPKAEMVEAGDGNKSTRRRTMPPNSFHSFTSSSIDTATPNFSRPLSYMPARREPSFSYQSHQSRKSVGSFTFQSSPGFQTSTMTPRRVSIASESSPNQRRRTSLIGSFEESILRGRMSSPASKPFEFVAQIGVMGKGDCPANLKCPAHVSVPFQAVFYSYPSTQNLRSIADDAPSPYVGTIDLERSLKPIQLATKRKRAATVGADTEAQPLFVEADPRDPENTPIGKALARDAQLRRQHSGQSSSALNLGGAYRIPRQGQLQIIIKNSNKTAVKLFIVPYDLEGMEAGTKTFIRQKAYSTGSIIEDALSDNSQHPDLFDPLKDKHILRYLVHAPICCPSKGRFYLYDHIRVVFANRVPDGKEKLRNEVQLPEPRYSPWKAPKTSQQSASPSTLEFPQLTPASSQPASTAPFGDTPVASQQDSQTKLEQTLAESDPIPFHIPELANSSRSHATQNELPFVFPNLPRPDKTLLQNERAVSPVQGFFASTSPRSSPVPWGSSSTSSTHTMSPAPVEAGGGLLSRQFKVLHSQLSSSRRESNASPWAMGASLTRILSQEETSQESEDAEKHA